jgi:6-phosphogluconolactonase
VPIEVLADADAVAVRGAELFAFAAQEAAAARGAFTVALSGGETPRAMYRMLARQSFTQKIPWRRVHLYWSDERCVPPDSERSNYRAAHETFIRHVAIPAENVHRLAGEDDPELAARAYERELLAPPARPKQSTAPVPVLDLVLLGLGTDGHTASLFPHSPALGETERLVVPNEGENTGPRLTLTVPVINAARRVVFVVTGAAKAGMVAEVLAGLHIPQAIPAQLIAPENGMLTWLLDQSAAAELGGAAGV